MLQLICDQRLALILILVQWARTSTHEWSEPWRLVLCHMMWLAQLCSAIFDTGYKSLWWVYSFFIIFMNVIIKTFKPLCRSRQLCRLFIYSISFQHYRNAIFFCFDHNFVSYRRVWLCYRSFILFYDKTILNHSTNELLFCFCNFVKLRSCLCTMRLKHNTATVGINDIIRRQNNVISRYLHW